MWEASGITPGVNAPSLLSNSSAGGQLEHPSEEKRSSTTGVSSDQALLCENAARSPAKRVTAPRANVIARIMAIKCTGADFLLIRSSPITNLRTVPQVPGD